MGWPASEAGHDPGGAHRSRALSEERDHPRQCGQGTDEEECSGRDPRSRGYSYEAAEPETDSFDEEVELLRAEADLVEAAADFGTTSADDDVFTTDADMDDDEDGLAALPMAGPSRRLRPGVVIEEDDEDISSGLDDDPGGLQVGKSEMRNKLWAQSLLRLKRSIDEVFSLCEYESDETLCDQVRAILETASADFGLLIKQFEVQQEYALLPGELPFKAGVAWTTRTPRVSRATDREPVLEVLARAQVFSPSSASGRQAASRSAKSPDSSAKRRSRSLDPTAKSTWPEEAETPRSPSLDRSAAPGEASSVELDVSSREDQLHVMVQSALQRVGARLGRPAGRLSPEELLKRSEDKQRRALKARLSQDDQRAAQLRLLEGRIVSARERRQQREKQMERELLEKMTRARRQYQDQLRKICQRARKENRKTAEVAFIAKEALKSEKDNMNRKQDKAHVTRLLLREQMRQKLIESANRVARVSENRRKQQELWQEKLQQGLEEKERLAEERRKEHIKSIRLKSQGQESRSEMVRGKRRELQEEDEKTSQEFLRFRGKSIARLALSCDGLPDGVREEVAENLQPGSRAAVQSSLRSREKASTRQRATTPPPAASHPLLQESPGSRGAVTETSDGLEALGEDGPVRRRQSDVLSESLVAPPSSSSPPASPSRFEGHELESLGADASADASGVCPATADAFAGGDEQRSRKASATSKPRTPLAPASRAVVGATESRGAGRGRTKGQGSSANRCAGTSPNAGPTSSRASGAGSACSAVLVAGCPGISSTAATGGPSATSVDRPHVDSSASAAPSEFSDDELGSDPEATEDAGAEAVGGDAAGGGAAEVANAAITIGDDICCETTGGDAAAGDATAPLAHAAPQVPRPGASALGPGRAAGRAPKSEAKGLHRRRTIGGGAQSQEAGSSRAAPLVPAHEAPHLEALRGKLAKSAMPDDDALRLACGAEGSRTAAVNAAHRARISKLNTDLSKVLGFVGTSSGAAAEEPSQLLPGVQPINDLERLDAVLDAFGKVLGQSQQEADCALVLQLGSAATVVDICRRIKNSIKFPTGAAERSGGVPPAWRQLSNVMLSALKWLGLLCKHKPARVFLLLTNRIIVLADVAAACVDANFDNGILAADSQGGSFLFLPQVLHVLSLHVKQTLPEPAAGLQQTLISYLLVCGLSERLRDLFKRAEPRGMRLFDGASPVPLFLLRAMGFLGTLVSAYRLPNTSERAVADTGSLEDDGTPVLRMLRRTELFGIVNVLVSILLAEGRREKPPNTQVQKLPQTVTSLCVQAVRIINHVARIDLPTLQAALGACRHELYHLFLCLFDYCASRMQGIKPGHSGDETELLHEAIMLLGYYCLRCAESQGIMSYGEGQTLLSKVTSLPLYYFMDERGCSVLFPTLLATCFQSKHNLELLRNEMNLSLLRKFLESNLEMRELGTLPEVAMQGFGGRFPPALWQEALEFFADEPP